jgi:hypothetical protein
MAEICEVHGVLKRSCYTCMLETDNKELNEKVEAYEKTLKEIAEFANTPSKFAELVSDKFTPYARQLALKATSVLELHSTSETPQEEVQQSLFTTDIYVELFQSHALISEVKEPVMFVVKGFRQAKREALKKLNSSENPFNGVNFYTNKSVFLKEIVLAK